VLSCLCRVLSFCRIFLVLPLNSYGCFFLMCKLRALLVPYGLPHLPQIWFLSIWSKDLRTVLVVRLTYICAVSSAVSLEIAISNFSAVSTAWLLKTALILAQSSLIKCACAAPRTSVFRQKFGSARPSNLTKAYLSYGVSDRILPTKSGSLMSWYHRLLEQPVNMQNTSHADILFLSATITSASTKRSGSSTRRLLVSLPEERSVVQTEGRSLPSFDAMLILVKPSTNVVCCYDYDKRMFLRLEL
jgi:hypothetical protein